jgi:histidyl-tRNA synthetase
VPVELGYGTRKLPRELERANRLGVAWAVIAGDNELARGEALVREMRSGEQRAVPLDRLAEELIRLGSSGAGPR